MAARLPKGSPISASSESPPDSDRETREAERPLGVHLVASIDADLYQGLVRYCTAKRVPLSRAVNNALSLYFTGRPRSEKPRRGRTRKLTAGARVWTEGPPPRGEGVGTEEAALSTRKIPISVHVDVDLVVLVEEYCAVHRVYLSSVVNRALALWLHRGTSRSTP